MLHYVDHLVANCVRLPVVKSAFTQVTQVYILNFSWAKNSDLKFSDTIKM